MSASLHLSRKFCSEFLCCELRHICRQDQIIKWDLLTRVGLTGLTGCRSDSRCWCSSRLTTVWLSLNQQTQTLRRLWADPGRHHSMCVCVCVCVCVCSWSVMECNWVHLGLLKYCTLYSLCKQLPQGGSGVLLSVCATQIIFSINPLIVCFVKFLKIVRNVVTMSITSFGWKEICTSKKLQPGNDLTEKWLKHLLKQFIINFLCQPSD